jgi:hypothetical protein
MELKVHIDKCTTVVVSSGQMWDEDENPGPYFVLSEVVIDPECDRGYDISELAENKICDSLEQMQKYFNERIMYLESIRKHE